jgi:hypothetical protein
VLRAYDDKYAADFPASWRVERRLVLGFVARTREMFLEILSAGDDEARSVTVVLKALQKALVFEKEADARFQIMPAAAADADDESDGAKLARAPIVGSLSGVFDPFMDPYVALEKSNMEEMMAKVTADDAVDRDGALPVLASSVHMFAYIKTSVRRCTALTTGQTFYKLHRAFCDCLRAYAARLASVVGAGDAGDRLRAGLLDAATAADDAVGAAPAIRAAEAACYALNTAEYVRRRRRRRRDEPEDGRFRERDFRSGDLRAEI